MEFVSAASLLSAMDRTAAPCANFFQYACGTWNRRHVIPEDRSSISTFEVLANQLQVILKRILEEPPNDEDNNATLKAKMFYKSCMDIRGYNDKFFELNKLNFCRKVRANSDFLFFPFLFFSNYKNCKIFFHRERYLTARFSVSCTGFSPVSNF